MTHIPPGTAARAAAGVPPAHTPDVASPPSPAADRSPRDPPYDLAFTVLQHRLDGYRNTALAVTGGALAVMAVLYTPVLEKPAEDVPPIKRYILLLMVLTIGYFTRRILRELQTKFREMSGIIVRLDAYYGFTSAPFPIPGGTPLYPASWGILSKDGLGWGDFVIRQLQIVIGLTTVINLIVIAIIFFRADFENLANLVERVMR